MQLFRLSCRFYILKSSALNSVLKNLYKCLSLEIVEELIEFCLDYHIFMQLSKFYYQLCQPTSSS